MQAHAGPEDPLEIIELRSRLASEMVPVLRPLLAPDDALVASDGKLIVRTDPRTLAEIRRVVSELDTPARNLVLTVRHRGAETRRQAGVSAGGAIEIGEDGAVVIGRSAPEKGVTVRGGAQELRSTAREEYQLRALDGQPAYIDTGRIAHFPQHSIVPAPGGGAIAGGVGEVRARRGFYVVPRLQGDRVMLAIAPATDRFADTRGTVDVDRVTTTVSGPLGAWIALGAAEQSGAQHGAGTVFYEQGSTAALSAYEVKVELVP